MEEKNPKQVMAQHLQRTLQKNYLIPKGSRVLLESILKKNHYKVLFGEVF
jgi:hypothetical protein